MAMEHSLVAPIQELERAYRYFNEKLFDNSLNEKVIITIQTRGRRKNALAWYWQNRWNSQTDVQGNANNSEAIAELNFSAETIRTNDSYESLIHEMVHHYCALHQIQDCSRNGKYHNKKFKKSAESSGLTCQRDNINGWAYTSLGEMAIRVKKELNPQPELFKYLRYEKSSASRKKKLKKWSCLCYTFWSEAGNLIRAKCLNCEEVFFDG